MITIDRKAIAGAAAAINRIMSGPDEDFSRCTILSAKDDTLEIRGTNFTLWIALNLPCQGDLPEVATNSARLVEVITQMRSDKLTISEESGGIIIAGERKERRRLPRIIRESFARPEPLKNEVSVGLQADAFRAGVSFARPFVQVDMGRPELSGIHIHSIRGAVRAVGAFRGGMGFCEVGSALAEFAVSIPLDLIDALDRSLPDEGPFFLAITERQVEASWAGGSIRSPIIGVRFPDYELAIPGKSQGTLLVNADELVGAINSVRSLGRESKTARSSIVKLTLNGSVSLVAASEKGDADEPVDAEYSGAPMEIGLMVSQVVAGLASLKSAPMQIGFGDATSPIVFRSDRHADRLAVITPCHV